MVMGREAEVDIEYGHYLSLGLTPYQDECD